MKRILRATATVGMSSVLTVVLGALRYKFVAVELGPAGVGLLGLLTSAAAFGVILFGLGLNTSGVQATAAASRDALRFHRTRVALLLGSRWLGCVGGLIAALLGVILAASILPKPAQPALMIWLGVALAAMVISGGQLALLNGIGRIGALARSNVWGSVVGTVVTIASVYFSGQAGLIAALAAAPLATLACSSWYVRREPKVYPLPRFSEWWPELRGMFGLGGVVMLGLLLGSATQLIIRVWLQRSQGLSQAGYFQAAWTITSLYLGFVLTALAVEYFPRISKQSEEPQRLNASVDKQIRVALLLGGPVLLWMMVLSPVALHVLYAEDFQSAAGILRWQLFGDIFKIVGWAVAFLLLARKARGAFFIAELSWNICYLLLALPLASERGLSGLGIAYVSSYALYLLVTLWLARRATRFLVQRHTFGLLAGLLLVGGITLWSVSNGSNLGLWAGGALASGVTAASFFVLRGWLAGERGSGNEVNFV